MNSIYKVELTKAAVKFIKKQDRSRREQIGVIIDLLKENPYQAKNIKPLKGYGENVFRVRFGDFRLLYKVNNEKLVILIIKIGPRGDVYKGI